MGKGVYGECGYGAQQHWEQIRGKLGMEWLAHPPVYGTLWRVLALLEMAQVEPVLSRWVQGVGGEAISVDGKSLRGSRRRAGLPALEVVVAAAQGIRLVLGREGVEEEKVTEAALKLLQGMPLEGKVVLCQSRRFNSVSFSSSRCSNGRR
jgi:hypothetical protein